MIDTTLLQPNYFHGGGALASAGLLIGLVILGHKAFARRESRRAKPAIAILTAMSILAAGALCVDRKLALDERRNAQDAEHEKAETLIRDGVKEKYQIEEIKLSLSTEGVHAAVSQSKLDAPDIKVVTEDGNKATFGAELDNTTGDVTLLGDVGGTAPSELER